MLWELLLCIHIEILCTLLLWSFLEHCYGFNFTLMYALIYVCLCLSHICMALYGDRD